MFETTDFASVYLTTRRFRPGCTKDDQISVQLNRVHLWSAIWTEFKSHFVAPTWTPISWPWFNWTAVVITWTTLIGSDAEAMTSHAMFTF